MMVEWDEIGAKNPRYSQYIVYNPLKKKSTFNLLSMSIYVLFLVTNSGVAIDLSLLQNWGFEQSHVDDEK